MSNSFIQSVSYAKLAKYDQTRTELPIRKYVLISNLLREEEQQQQQQQQQQYSDMITDNDEEQDMLLLEKHWFEACLNELDNDEEEEEETEGVQEQSSLKRQTDVQLHAIYNISNGRGIFVCCTTS